MRARTPSRPHALTLAPATFPQMGELALVPRVAMFQWGRHWVQLQAWQVPLACRRPPEGPCWLRQAVGLAASSRLGELRPARLCLCKAQEGYRQPCSVPGLLRLRLGQGQRAWQPPLPRIRGAPSLHHSSISNSSNSISNSTSNSSSNSNSNKASCQGLVRLLHLLHQQAPLLGIVRPGWPMATVSHRRRLPQRRR